jgi:hypothetical protein
MKIVRLNEFGKERFENILSTLATTSTDRNKNWFPALLKDYKSSKYLEWFFSIDTESNEVAAFSTIQDFGQNTYRMLTRCYIFEKYRRSMLPKLDTYNSPGTFLIQDQLKFLNYTYHSIFISLEHIRRKRTIANMSKKMSLNTSLEWQVADGMFLTCGNRDSMNCWQNICYSKNQPDLDKITYNEWTTKYGKMPH